MIGKSAELGIKLTREDGDMVDGTINMSGKAMDLVEGWCRLGRNLAKETGVPLMLLCALAAASDDMAEMQSERIDMSALRKAAEGSGRE